MAAMLSRSCVADADGFLDAPVGHAGGVFHHDVGEQGVRHVDRVLVEGAHAGVAPADVFHRAFDLLVRRADPFAHRERAVQIDGQAAEKVGQHVLGGEAHRDAADAAKGQHAGNAEPQGLQDDQDGEDDDADAPQLGQRVDRGAVDRPAGFRAARQNAVGSVADQAVQEPGQRGDDERVAGGHDEIGDGGAAVLVHDARGVDRAHHPQDQRQRLAGSLDQGVVPNGRGAHGDFLDMAQQVIDPDIDGEDRDNHRQHLGKPGCGQEGLPELLCQIVHERGFCTRGLGGRGGWGDSI